MDLIILCLGRIVLLVAVTVRHVPFIRIGVLRVGKGLG